MMKIKVFVLFFLCVIPFSRSSAIDPSSAGAWATAGAVLGFGSFVAQKTVAMVLHKGLLYMPFISEDGATRIASTVSATTMIPLAAVFSLRYGKLFWAFFYILYSGNRYSPLLAREILNDLRVYVEHLKTMKSVQKELKQVIDEINAVVAAKRGAHSIDPYLTAALSSIVTINEKYVERVLQQVRRFLPEDDLSLKGVESLVLSDKIAGISGDFARCVDALYTCLRSEKQIAYNPEVLNQLVKDLVEYWQTYVAGLALEIDASLQRCSTIYAIEQFITLTLDYQLKIT